MNYPVQKNSEVTFVFIFLMIVFYYVFDAKDIFTGLFLGHQTSLTWLDINQVLSKIFLTNLYPNTGLSLIFWGFITLYISRLVEMYIWSIKFLSIYLITAVFSFFTYLHLSPIDANYFPWIFVFNYWIFAFLWAYHTLNKSEFMTAKWRDWLILTWIFVWLWLIISDPWFYSDVWWVLWWLVFWVFLYYFEKLKKS